MAWTAVDSGPESSRRMRASAAVETASPRCAGRRPARRPREAASAAGPVELATGRQALVAVDHDADVGQPQRPRDLLERLGKAGAERVADAGRHLQRVAAFAVEQPVDRSLEPARTGSASRATSSAEATPESTTTSPAYAASTRPESSA